MIHVQAPHLLLQLAHYLGSNLPFNMVQSTLLLALLPPRVKLLNPRCSARRLPEGGEQTLLSCQNETLERGTENGAILHPFFRSPSCSGAVLPIPLPSAVVHHRASKQDPGQPQSFRMQIISLREDKRRRHSPRNLASLSYTMS